MSVFYRCFYWQNFNSYYQKFHNESIVRVKWRLKMRERKKMRYSYAKPVNGWCCIYHVRHINWKVKFAKQFLREHFGRFHAVGCIHLNPSHNRWIFSLEQKLAELTCFETKSTTWTVYDGRLWIGEITCGADVDNLPYCRCSFTRRKSAWSIRCTNWISSHKKYITPQTIRLVRTEVEWTTCVCTNYS